MFPLFADSKLEAALRDRYRREWQERRAYEKGLAETAPNQSRGKAGLRKLPGIIFSPPPVGTG